jgi:cell surface protein SprA
MLIGLKTVNVNYTKKGSTYLPGYLPQPSMFGGGNSAGDPEWNGGQNTSSFAPGVPFLLGWQDRHYAERAANKGWITVDTTLNDAYTMSENEKYTFRAVWEPIPDLKINFNAARTQSKSISEYYLYDESSGNFSAESFSESGTFSMTTLTLGTAFFKIGKGTVTTSEAFENMKSYRQTIAHRLANQRAASSVNYDPDAVSSEDSEYPDGYGPNSLEVMIPAFLAAYQDKDPNSVSLSLFPSLKYIRPNWSVSYEGMVSRVPGLNKIMKSLSFEHSYRSIFSIGSYSTNSDFVDEGNGITTARDLSDDFVSYYDISTVSITEAFSPLIGMDITWHSDLSTSFEVNRTRNVSLSLSNNQLTEICGNEYTVGVGYRFSHMDLIIKTKKSQKSFSNDLNLRLDFSYAKSKTTLRQLDEDDNQITAGQGIFSLESYADYRLSEKFQMKVYYDKTINNPYTSSSYRTSTDEFGVSFKFTLSNY